MSVPVVIGCLAAVLVIGGPVLVGAGQLEARHRAAGAADAAALAAADAAAGLIAAKPCEIAADVVAAMATQLDSCKQELGGDVRVVVSVQAGIGRVSGRARAGLIGGASAPGGAVGENGWAWPSDVRGVTQGHHDGQSIDLAVSAEGALYAPYGGVVVRAGPLGGGMPPACMVNPSWWRGMNHGVVIRHEVNGRTLFSSHNHVKPGSPARFGIAAGTRVQAGDRVATAGMSGCTSGPHTHFTLSTTQTNAFSNVDPFSVIGRPEHLTHNAASHATL